MVSNDSQFNDLRVSHRLNIQTAILQAKFIRDRMKLLLIIREGMMKIFDLTHPELQIVKQSQLMWADITAIDLRLDETIVVGHESGVIYT